MALKLHSGELRHFITFRRPTVSQNDEGGQEATYEDFLNTRAAVYDTRQARTELPIALLKTKEFIIRYASGREAINKDFLIVYDGNTYTIESIENINEDKGWIKFTAKAKTDG